MKGSSKGDWEHVDDLVRQWDRVMAQNPDPHADPTVAPEDRDNPYLREVEGEETVRSTADVNLVTAFTLLSSWGFAPDHQDRTATGKVRAKFAQAGEAMVQRAEDRLPRTLTQLYGALEHTRGVNNIASRELYHQIRGMILIVYAWGYVIDRTRQLEVRDNEIYPALAEFSMTLPGSAERARLTRSAERRLEQTTGLLLQAIDSAQRQLAVTVRLIMTGALMMLYALANVHYSPGADYLEQTPEAPRIILPT